MTDNTELKPLNDAELVGAVADYLKKNIKLHFNFYSRDASEYEKHAQGIAKAALAALKPHLGGGWLPIESAPKDETQILVTDGIHIGYVYRSGACYRVCASNEPTDMSKTTHWQPLPQPPSVVA